MVDDQDWKAAMNSEIFRSFVTAELQKEAAQREDDARLIQSYLANQIREETNAIKEAETEVNEREKVLDAFGVFEATIKNNPELFSKFKKIKQALIHDVKLRDKVDANFVNGIMMMDLGE